MAYHVGLGQAAYDAFMNSLAWVCHVTQTYSSSYFVCVNADAFP